MDKGNTTRLPNIMDDIEQGSEGPAVDDEEVLDFPEDVDDEMMDLDMDLDMDHNGVMSGLVIPDARAPDIAVPDLESYATTKVTQAGVRSVNPVSILTGVYRVARGVL